MRATGSSMESMTAAKSMPDSCWILWKTSGTKSVHSTASTTQMTTSVTSAASQRGTCHPRMRIQAKRFTNGLPMTASTADTSMYMTTALKNHMR